MTEVPHFEKLVYKGLKDYIVIKTAFNSLD